MLQATDAHHAKIARLARKPNTFTSPGEPVEGYHRLWTLAIKNVG